MSNFRDKFKSISEKNQSYLCVGLDVNLDKFPESLKNENDSIFLFNKAIIDATKDLVCAYKPNFAFYFAYGLKGLESLKRTIEYIPDEIPVILDIKSNDIGNTAKMYATGIFNEMNADATTINPYMGEDSVLPFLSRTEKYVFALCLTSNPGSQDFQYLKSDGKTLYVNVMNKLSKWNHESNGNLGVVVGATHAEELRELRELGDDMIFLIPGIGSQGGDVEKVVKNAKINQGLGIINVSRKVIFASSEDDFARKARESALNYRNMINSYI